MSPVPAPSLLVTPVAPAVVAVLAQSGTKPTGSPGVLGFVVTFAVALVVVGLVLAMTSSLRRVKRRAELEGSAPQAPERRAVPRDGGGSEPSGADRTHLPDAGEGHAGPGGPTDDGTSRTGP